MKRYSQNSVTLLLQEKTDGEWVKAEIAIEMQVMLNELEYVEYTHSGDTYSICPVCKSEWEHKKGCRLDLLLRKARGE